MPAAPAIAATNIHRIVRHKLHSFVSPSAQIGFSASEATQSLWSSFEALLGED